jgi:hypothetical protein
LRGKDIKRGGYKWGGVWVIATFPAKNIDIKNYPAVEKYLTEAQWSKQIPNGYGKLKLEQTGVKHEVDGVRFVSRKKTGNKWFELQDTIAYMDDFDRKKLCWTPVNSEYRFAIVSPGIFLTNSAFIITGENLEHLCRALNSPAYIYYFSLLTTDSYQYGAKELFEQVKVSRNNFQFSSE